MNPSPGQRVYACSDGEIEVRVENAEQWRGLAVCVGRPELAYDGSWEVVKTASADGPVSQVLEEHFGEEPADVWLRRLEAHGVPATRIR